MISKTYFECLILFVRVSFLVFLQQTFIYDSSFWSNKESYNLPGGQTGFDTQETKLPTYWNTSFNKLCLGMTISAAQYPNFVVINKSADSLYSLIADGQYRNVPLGLAE